MIEELRQKINTLENRIEELSKRVNQVTFLDPLSQKILGDFVDVKLVDNVVLSSKSNSSENQAVDEGGAAIYQVLKPPDAFLQVTDSDKTIYYLPVYT